MCSIMSVVCTDPSQNDIVCPPQTAFQELCQPTGEFVLTLPPNVSSRPVFECIPLVIINSGQSFGVQQSGQPGVVLPPAVNPPAEYFGFDVPLIRTGGDNLFGVFVGLTLLFIGAIWVITESKR